MIDLEQNIRERAYQLWEQDGRIHGRHEQHWHLAKLELSSAVDASSVAIEAPAAAAPAKKGRRAAAKPVAAAPAPVPAAAPRRRRTSATLQ